MFSLLELKKNVQKYLRKDTQFLKPEDMQPKRDEETKKILSSSDYIKEDSTNSIVNLWNAIMAAVFQWTNQNPCEWDRSL